MSSHVMLMVNYFWEGGGLTQGPQTLVALHTLRYRACVGGCYVTYEPETNWKAAANPREWCGGGDDEGTVSKVSWRCPG